MRNHKKFLRVTLCALALTTLAVPALAVMSTKETEEEKKAQFQRDNCLENPYSGVHDCDTEKVTGDEAKAKLGFLLGRMGASEDEFPSTSVLKGFLTHRKDARQNGQGEEEITILFPKDFRAKPPRRLFFKVIIEFSDGAWPYKIGRLELTGMAPFGCSEKDGKKECHSKVAYPLSMSVSQSFALQMGGSSSSGGGESKWP
jgi:hypothetical protein